MAARTEQMSNHPQAARSTLLKLKINRLNIVNALVQPLNIDIWHANTRPTFPSPHEEAELPGAVTWQWTESSVEHRSRRSRTPPGRTLAGLKRSSNTTVYHLLGGERVLVKDPLTAEQMLSSCVPTTQIKTHFKRRTLSGSRCSVAVWFF